MSHKNTESGILKDMTIEDLVEADKNSTVIVFSSGTLETGESFWVYLEIKPSRYREFMQLTEERKPLRLGEYGAILKHGFGEEVPERIREEMKTLYGCDDNYTACLIRDVKKAQLTSLRQGKEQRLNDILLRLKHKD